VKAATSRLTPRRSPNAFRAAPLFFIFFLRIGAIEVCFLINPDQEETSAGHDLSRGRRAAKALGVRATPFRLALENLPVRHPQDSD
jgi:hypothetical protein